MSVIHLDPNGLTRSRVVIIGAKGFVGSAILSLQCELGGSVFGIGRADVDLLASNAADMLEALLKPGDAVVVVSALAPCKSYGMFTDNIVMMRAIIDALERIIPSYVLYISSDAVYSDASLPLTENSFTAPDNLHGAMHFARETMLRGALGEVPLGVIRPTLIYGAGDPHNGYGPNRFRRLAQTGDAITIFGEGEELRDHVCIDDVAKLASLMIAHRSVGILNAASGEVISFLEIARLLSKRAGGLPVLSSQRLGPIPHGGFRAFNQGGVAAAFPNFTFTPPVEGITSLFEKTLPLHG